MCHSVASATVSQSVNEQEPTTLLPGAVGRPLTANRDAESGRGLPAAPGCEVEASNLGRTRKKARCNTQAGLIQSEEAQITATGILPIRACHSLGPVMCADVPPESTATVTGMSTTSNS